MNYGFVIDNRKCIGCHACSTACKSENDVPLGVNRTWVKYVEVGVFPNSKRHFQVTRCNHCANPPCVRICPVTAMYQREDGIVEFDPSLCIGCKACMQACPYDAIYIDPNSGTAAKCHYCSHRVDIGLEPACVVVCPTHAIIAGDMDNPSTEISHVLAQNKVMVRKPEQGTAPNLFYIEGEAATLHPTATERTPDTFMWSDVIPLHENGNGSDRAADKKRQLKRSNSGEAILSPQSQGIPLDGPIQRGGSMAEHMIQVSYNAQHKVPWHWPVPSYLTTKGIGAGLFMILSLGTGLGLVAFDRLTYLVGGFLSLLFIGITTAFLVLDLEKPLRFFYMVFRPQWKSWLARGAFLLMGFSTLVGLWFLVELGAYLEWLPEAPALFLRPIAIWGGFVLAVGVTIYSGFLFGQAEGRDLWQSSLLPIHLLVQAVMVGSGFVFLMGLLVDLSADLESLATTTFIASLVLDLIVTTFGEFGMPHASETAAIAAHQITHGRYKNHYWWGSIGLGHIVPLVLLFSGLSFGAAAASICAIVGLYLYEYAFVTAPQEIPNS